jgi:hypothetical protein
MSSITTAQLPGIHDHQRITGRNPTRILAFGLVAAPAAMLSFFSLSGKYLPKDDPQQYLQQVADLGNRFPVATLAYMLAAGLNLLVALAIVRLLGWQPLAVVAASFTALASLGSLGFAGMNLFLWALVDELGVSADLVRGYTAFQDGAGFLVLAAITLPAAVMANVAFIAGLFRSRVAPVWVPTSLTIGFVAGSGFLGHTGSIVGGVFGLAAGIGLALAILRTEA